jgi:hypothetical protein
MYQQARERETKERLGREARALLLPEIQQNENAIERGGASRSMRSTWIKPAARWIAVLVSLVSFGFAALSYTGFWSEFRGDNQAANAANRFDLSYGPEAAQPVTSDDPAWKPLLRIIEKYTQARLLQDHAPKLLARSVAVSSDKLMAGDVVIAQWTAPTTPIVLFYTRWPDPGHGPFIKDKDFVTVGSLGDLHDWIRRDQADFDFLWRTLIFGALSLCFATFLALPDTQPPTAKSQGPSRIVSLLAWLFPHK